MWLLDIQPSKVYTPETKTNKCSACILLPEHYTLEETSEHLHFMQVKLNLNR